MSIQTSFAEVASWMVSGYSYLKSHFRTQVKGSQYIDENIHFLRSTIASGGLSDNLHSDQDISRFFRIFLDLAGIISCTKGQFEPSLKIGDIKLIGKRRDIAGILNSGQTSIDDWLSSILFQGWARLHEPDIIISDDLRYKLSKHGKNCDFKVVGKKIPSTLIECKRINTNLSNKTQDQIFENLINKIVFKCDQAEKQFTSTIRNLDKRSWVKTIIIDISSYGDDSKIAIPDGSVIGLCEQYIQQINEQLSNARIKGIDQIILAWTNVFFFNNAPRALAYYTHSLTLGNTQVDDSNFKYSGWTVEFYPRPGKNPSKYLELRLSATARSYNWIYLSWKNMTGNLIKIR